MKDKKKRFEACFNYEATLGSDKKLTKIEGKFESKNFHKLLHKIEDLLDNMDIKMCTVTYKDREWYENENL